MQNMSGGKSALGLDSNVVSMLCYIANVCCYLGLILSIVTVVTDKTNKLPRFHAFQSILLSAAGIVIGIVFGALNGIAVASRSGALSMLVGLLGMVIGFGFFALIIYTAIQAYQGKMFKLPVIGDLADNWSN
jgi:uncharacterized membrane protein